MARRIRDVARGGGKAVKAEIEGLRELEAKLRDLISLDDDSLSPGQKSIRTKWARERLNSVLGDAADMVKVQARANAQAQKWPKAVIAAIFSYADIDKARGKFKYSIRGALAGIRKGAPPRRDMEIYREWNPGRSWGGIVGGYLHPTGKRVLKKGLVSGRLIGMSLASMFEFGTSKMAARPAFRPALRATRQRVLQFVANGYRGVIEQLSAAK